MPEISGTRNNVKARTSPNDQEQLQVEITTLSERPFGHSKTKDFDEGKRYTREINAVSLDPTGIRVK